MRLDSAPADQVYLKYLINSKKNPHKVLATSDTFLFQKNKINLDKVVFDVNDEYSTRNPYILMAKEDMNGIKEKIQTSWLAPNDDRHLFLFNHFLSRHPVGTFKKALNGVNTRGYGGMIVSPSSSCKHHPDNSKFNLFITHAIRLNRKLFATF